MFWCSGIMFLILCQKWKKIKTQLRFFTGLWLVLRFSFFSSCFCCFQKSTPLHLLLVINESNVCISEITENSLIHGLCTAFIIKLWASCLRLVLLSGYVHICPQEKRSRSVHFPSSRFRCSFAHPFSFTVHLTIIAQHDSSQNSGPLGTELLIGEGPSISALVSLELPPTMSGQHGTTQ